MSWIRKKETEQMTNNGFQNLIYLYMRNRTKGRIIKNNSEDFYRKSFNIFEIADGKILFCFWIIEKKIFSSFSFFLWAFCDVKLG